MSTHPTTMFFRAALVLLPTGVLVSGQEVLHLYAPPGPLPAINEAATAFQARTGTRVEIKSGTLDSWAKAAAEDADLVYATADYLMSRYLRTKDLRVDPETVTPLYVQSSIVLVRPENPKQIQDFPDLLRPSVNVMVVTGTGFGDVWEEMAGRLEDIRTLRTLRKNVVAVAESGDEAMRLWKQRQEIDAWITWNIWFVPLRDEAKLVPVSRDYGIHRRCSIAPTHRGKSNPAAADFMRFVNSGEGFKVFESWGWVQGDRGPLAVNTDICAVCRINEDRWSGAVGSDLLELSRLMQEYEELGVPPEEVHISAVFDGDAAYWLLSDQAYRSVKSGERVNPNKPLIEELTRLGVSIEISEQAMRDYGWQKGDILPEVKVVPSAQIRMIDLQEQGYAHILLGGPRSGHLRYRSRNPQG